MKFYTLWKKMPDSVDAVLLKNESLYKTKKNAFKRAKTLATRVNADAILVRLVKIVDGDCSADCLQWDFPCVP